MRRLVDIHSRPQLRDHGKQTHNGPKFRRQCLELERFLTGGHLQDTFTSPTGHVVCKQWS